MADEPQNTNLVRQGVLAILAALGAGSGVWGYNLLVNPTHEQQMGSHMEIARLRDEVHGLDLQIRTLEARQEDSFRELEQIKAEIAEFRPFIYRSESQKRER